MTVVQHCWSRALPSKDDATLSVCRQQAITARQQGMYQPTTLRHFHRVWQQSGHAKDWLQYLEQTPVAFYVMLSWSGLYFGVRYYQSLQQEKQMSTQPDMILQFAQHLKDVYGNQMQSPEVYAEAYVTINGRSSRLLIDPKVNLAAEQDGFANKKWILAQADK